MLYQLNLVRHLITDVVEVASVCAVLGECIFSDLVSLRAAAMGRDCASDLSHQPEPFQVTAALIQTGLV